MITLLSWNIQNGLAVDGCRSIERIAQEIIGLETPDVICLQEVSRGVVLDSGRPAPDQIAELSGYFPQHSVHFGPAYDVLGKHSPCRAQYGNLILSRLPVLSVFCHPLPQPAQKARRQMPRQATEVNVSCNDEPLRIMTTHLEFHSIAQRRAQIQAVKRIHARGVSLSYNPSAASTDGPYQQIRQARRTVICGDLNCLPDSNEFAQLTSAVSTPRDRLIDCWKLLHPDKPHEATCGIFDHRQWPQGAHCRDYFLVSDNLADSIVGLDVNRSISASDHQPVLLTLQIPCPPDESSRQ